MQKPLEPSLAALPNPVFRYLAGSAERVRREAAVDKRGNAPATRARDQGHLKATISSAIAHGLLLTLALAVSPR